VEVGQLQPVQTVREYSFMSNPRTPAAVKGGVRKLGPITASSSLDELARYKDKVLDVGKLVGLDPLESGLLSREQKREFKQKFRDVGGSWCCAPVSEKKAGAPHSHGFRLMTV